MLALTVAAGLASRRFPEAQPAWIGAYAGDTLWAAMVFWILALVAPQARTVALGSLAVGIAWAVELSQLVRVPWLDAVRATRLGALALGQGFLWSDFVCYTVGAAIAAVLDRALQAGRRAT